MLGSGLFSLEVSWAVEGLGPEVVGAVGRGLGLLVVEGLGLFGVEGWWLFTAYRGIGVA